MQQQKPEIIGSNGSNMPALIAMLVDLYKTEMADDDLSISIGQLLLTVGEFSLEQYARQVWDQINKKKLLRIVREARQHVLQEFTLMVIPVGLSVCSFCKSRFSADFISF